MPREILSEIRKQILLTPLPLKKSETRRNRNASRIASLVSERVCVHAGTTRTRTHAAPLERPEYLFNEPSGDFSTGSNHEWAVDVVGVTDEPRTFLLFRRFCGCLAPSQGRRATPRRFSSPLKNRKTFRTPVYFAANNRRIVFDPVYRSTHTSQKTARDRSNPR